MRGCEWHCIFWFLVLYDDDRAPRTSFTDYIHPVHSRQEFKVSVATGRNGRDHQCRLRDVVPTVCSLQQENCTYWIEKLPHYVKVESILLNSLVLFLFDAVLLRTLVRNRPSDCVKMVQSSRTSKRYDKNRSN
jgi:hypothetical protein